MTQFRREQDLAAYVVGHFRDGGWEVYQEVSALGHRADLVVCHQPAGVVMVVEAKLSATLGLLEQGVVWLGAASAVWLAIPDGKHSPMFWRVLESLGLGCLLVSYSGGVRVGCAPRLNRRPLGNWTKWLHDEQKTESSAGVKGAFWTPYKGTCAALRTFVERNPGAPLADAVRLINHHYTSGAVARRCLSKLILDGAVPGVALREGGLWLT